MLFEASTDPLDVSVLILPQSSMMSVASTIDPMRAANRYARQELFRWTIASLDAKAVTLSCGLPIPADLAIGETGHYDLLVIIAGFEQDKWVDREGLAQIRKLARRFKWVGAVEAGPWIMARAGLLAGKAATVHWEDLEDFAQTYHDIEVKADRFVIDKRTFTTGGASPTFDLMLHLIRQRYGYPVALEVASAFIYDQARQQSDAQPFVSLGQLPQHDPLVAAAIRIMENAIEAPVPVPAIARRLKIPSRTFEHRFKKAIGTPPGTYFLQLRLQVARRMVINTGLPVYEIAVRAGFNSISAFSRIFKQHYGVSPGGYRKGR